MNSSNILSYLEMSSPNLNLTNTIHLQDTIKITEKMMADYPREKEIKSLEQQLLQNRDSYPLMVHLAVKLAKSKVLLRKIKKPIHITVLFAVYKEHNRIRTQEEHPHGEDFLLRKIAQLNWLFSNTPNFSWDMIVIDDGDPKQSGKIAQNILSEKFTGKNVRVLFLENAIQQMLSVTYPMQSTDESRKGGAILYGMWEAIQKPKPNHIIVYTDADLSTHLGQVGLLIDPIVHQGKDAGIGSRREKESVVLKTGSRNNRGKLFIYLWMQILPILNTIVDTQCGFKAFTSETVERIISDMLEKQFAFDIELLLKTETHRRNSIAKIPIAWIDSEAASTTTHLQPYLPMLQSVVKMYHKYLPENPRSQEFADFVHSLTEQKWNQLLDIIPEDIISREPSEFKDFQGVQAAELKMLLSEK